LTIGARPPTDPLLQILFPSRRSPSAFFPRSCGGGGVGRTRRGRDVPLMRPLIGMPHTNAPRLRLPDWTTHRQLGYFLKLLAAKNRAVTTIEEGRILGYFLNDLKHIGRHEFGLHFTCRWQLFGQKNLATPLVARVTDATASPHTLKI